MFEIGNDPRHNRLHKYKGDLMESVTQVILLKSEELTLGEEYPQ